MIETFSFLSVLLFAGSIVLLVLYCRRNEKEIIRLEREMTDLRWEIKLRESRAQMPDYPVLNTPDYSSEVALEEEEEYTVSERVMIRENEFEKRIASMRGGVAEERDGVKNLDHRIVDLKDKQLPDVEETD